MPKRPEIASSDFAEPLGITPMSVIPFEPLLFGNASNNGRMLGEMDAKNPIVGMINEIAHVLTGRSEIKAKKKTARRSPRQALAEEEVTLRSRMISGVFARNLNPPQSRVEHDVVRNRFTLFGIMLWTELVVDHVW